MMLKGGSPAIHKMGNIGREYDDYIRVSDMNDEYYIGNFEYGFGFVGVKFKKEDVRRCTQDEIDKLNKSWYGINNMPLYQYHLNSAGYFIKNHEKLEFSNAKSTLPCGIKIEKDHDCCLTLCPDEEKILQYKEDPTDKCNPIELCYAQHKRDNKNNVL